LDTELDPVFIQPATSDNSDSVKGGDTFLSEEGGQNVAGDTADSVRGKELNNAVCQTIEHVIKWNGVYIEGIIVVAEELELSGKIANCTGGNTVENGRGWWGHVNDIK
jgi:hypothetical protein